MGYNLTQRLVMIFVPSRYSSLCVALLEKVVKHFSQADDTLTENISVLGIQYVVFIHRSMPSGF